MVVVVCLLVVVVLLVFGDGGGSVGGTFAPDKRARSITLRSEWRESHLFPP